MGTDVDVGGRSLSPDAKSQQDTEGTQNTDITGSSQKGSDGGVSSGDGTKADVDIALRLYQVHSEVKAANVFSAFWFNYRYVSPYSDGTVPGQFALEKIAGKRTEFMCGWVW